MLLIEKNRPVRALCGQCRRLYEPTKAELASAAKVRGEKLVCFSCFKKLLVLTKKAV